MKAFLSRKGIVRHHVEDRGRGGETGAMNRVCVDSKLVDTSGLGTLPFKRGGPENVLNPMVCLYQVTYRCANRQVPHVVFAKATCMHTGKTKWVARCEESSLLVCVMDRRLPLD